MRHNRLFITLALVMLLTGVATALEARAGADLLQGRWVLIRYLEGEEDVTQAHPGENWTFSEDGVFARESSEGKSWEKGRYTLVEQQLHLELEGAEEPEVWEILKQDESHLELRAPAVVSREGIVIRPERFSAFFHS